MHETELLARVVFLPPPGTYKDGPKLFAVIMNLTFIYLTYKGHMTLREFGLDKKLTEKQ